MPAPAIVMVALQMVAHAIRGSGVALARFFVPTFIRGVGSAFKNNAKVFAFRNAIVNLLVKPWPRTVKGWAKAIGIAAGTTAATTTAIVLIKDTFGDHPRRGFFTQTEVDKTINRDTLTMSILKDLAWTPVTLGLVWPAVRATCMVMKDVVVVGIKIYGTTTGGYFLANKMGLTSDTLQALGSNEGNHAADEFYRIAMKRFGGEKLTDEEKEMYDTMITAIALKNSEVRALTNEDLMNLRVVDGKLTLSTTSDPIPGTNIPSLSPEEAYNLTTGPDGKPVVRTDAGDSLPERLGPVHTTVPTPSVPPLSPSATANAPLLPSKTQESKAPLFTAPAVPVVPSRPDLKWLVNDQDAPCQNVEEDKMRDIFDITDHCACERQHDEKVMLSHDVDAAVGVKYDFFFKKLGKLAKNIGKTVLTPGSPLGGLVGMIPGASAVIGGINTARGMLGQGGQVAEAQQPQQAQPFVGPQVPGGFAPSQSLISGGMAGAPTWEIRGRAVLAPPGMIMYPTGMDGRACAPIAQQDGDYARKGLTSPLADMRDYDDAPPSGLFGSWPLFGHQSPGLASLEAHIPNTRASIRLGDLMDADTIPSRLQELCKSGALRRMLHKVRDATTFNQFMFHLRRMALGISKRDLDQMGGEEGLALRLMADRAKYRRANDYFKMKKFRKAFKKLGRVALAVGTGGGSEVARFALKKLKKMKKKKKRTTPVEDETPPEPESRAQPEPEEEFADEEDEYEDEEDDGGPFDSDERAADMDAAILTHLRDAGDRDTEVRR